MNDCKDTKGCKFYLYDFKFKSCILHKIGPKSCEEIIGVTEPSLRVCSSSNSTKNDSKSSSRLVTKGIMFMKVFNLQLTYDFICILAFDKVAFQPRGSKESFNESRLTTNSKNISSNFKLIQSLQNCILNFFPYKPSILLV